MHSLIEISQPRNYSYPRPAPQPGSWLLVCPSLGLSLPRALPGITRVLSALILLLCVHCAWETEAWRGGVLGPSSQRPGRKGNSRLGCPRLLRPEGPAAGPSLLPHPSPWLPWPGPPRPDPAVLLSLPDGRHLAAHDPSSQGLGAGPGPHHTDGSCAPEAGRPGCEFQPRTLGQSHRLSEPQFPHLQDEGGSGCCLPG